MKSEAIWKSTVSVQDFFLSIRIILEGFQMTDQEIQEIKHVVEEAYIRGIHGEQDKALIDMGFHPAFEMLVLDQNEVEKVDVPSWLQRIEAMKQENPELWSSKTNHEFKLIDVAGSAAVVKLDVYKGVTFFSTDFMLLYKFEDGWKVVSKVFSVQR
ncbi:MAG: hypothetical protein GTO14_08500 [Anaerolineales bacterium]|nr:hypothetical protein [Anaerolineales bacterium]